MIVACLAPDVKSYPEVYLQNLGNQELVCPICQGRLHRHGRKWRRVIVGGEKHLIPLQRTRCQGACRKTHLILPDFLSPYARHVLPARQEAALALAVHAGVEQVATALQVDPEQIRRWSKRDSRRLSRAVSALEAVAARLDPGRSPGLPPPGQPLLARLAQLCHRISPRLPTHTSLFGLANILLAWWGVRVWL